MGKCRFAAGLFVITAIALMLAWTWGLQPLSALGGLRPIGWTPADAVNNRLPIHLIPPAWISGKDNFEIEMKWSIVELKARLAFILALWFASIVVLHKKSPR